jgi:Flp pilus assembly protein CpaB
MRRSPLRIILIVIILLVVIAVVGVLLLSTANQGTATATPVASTQAAGGGTGATGGGAVVALPTATPVRVLEIVAAIQDIPRGFTIPPNAVALRRWPEDVAPIQAITNLDEVIGKVARVDIFREQPILSNMVVTDLSDIGATGSDLAATLPEGRVAISVPVDRITSVAYGIQPGDRVDVIVSLLFVNVDVAFQSLEPNLYAIITVNEEGRPIIGEQVPGRIDTIPAGIFGTFDVMVSPSESPRPQLVTQRTIQDAIVMWNGNFPESGRMFEIPPTPTPALEVTGPTPQATVLNGTIEPTIDSTRPDIVTLAVSPQDAVVLTWFVEARLPLTFAVRSASSIAPVNTEPASLDYILENYNIRIPERTAYSIEPAVRSIRRLFVGNQIELQANTGDPQ